MASLLHVACSQSHSLTVAGHCRAARLGWVQPKLQSERSGHQTETPGLSTYIERGQVTLNTYYVIKSGYQSASQSISLYVSQSVSQSVSQCVNPISSYPRLCLLSNQPSEIRL